MANHPNVLNKTRYLMKQYGLSKKAAYISKYRSYGWTAMSRKFNEPTRSTWRILSRSASRWSDGNVFDFSSLADHHY